MGGKQKKKTGGSKKKPSIFDKPMPNPFLDHGSRDKVPVKAENGKDVFDKPMENPFTSVEKSKGKKKVPEPTKLKDSPYTEEEGRPPAKKSKAKPKLMGSPYGEKLPAKKSKSKPNLDELMDSPYAQVEPASKKARASAVKMPKRKSREEVSSAKGWTYAVKRISKKKKS